MTKEELEGKFAEKLKDISLNYRRGATDTFQEFVLPLYEALQFYADRERWEHSTAYRENTVICGDDHYCYKGDYFYGGKSAIKALAEVEGKLK